MFRAWLRKAATPFAVPDDPFSRMARTARIDGPGSWWTDAALIALNVPAFVLIFSVQASGLAHGFFLMGAALFWPLWIHVRNSGPLWRLGDPRLRADFALTATPPAEMLQLVFGRPLLRSCLPGLVTFAVCFLTAWGRQGFDKLLAADFDGFVREMEQAAGILAVFMLPSLLSAAGLAHILTVRWRLERRTHLILLQLGWVSASLLFSAALLFLQQFSPDFRDASAGIATFVAYVLGLTFLAIYLWSLWTELPFRKSDSQQFGSPLPGVTRKFTSAIVLTLGLAAIAASLGLAEIPRRDGAYYPTITWPVFAALRTIGLILVIASSAYRIGLLMFRPLPETAWKTSAFKLGLACYFIASLPPLSGFFMPYLQAFLLADLAAIFLMIWFWKRAGRHYYRFH